MTDRDLHSRLFPLRVALGILCVYHLGVGLATFVSPHLLAAFGERFYGLHFDDPSGAQFVYMLKCLAMYALFTGGLLAVACWRPERSRAVVGLAALLLLMRAATRLACFDVAHQAFGVTWSHNLFNVVLLLIQASVLIWGSWVLTQARHAEAFRVRPERSRRLRPVASGVIARGYRGR